MSHHPIAVALAATIIAAPGAALAADPVQLKIGFPAPASSFVNTEAIAPWTKDVEKDANGTVTFKLFAGPTLGTFRNIYDRTVSGVADISFGVFGPIGKQFPRLNVAELPYETRTGEETALAQWRLYEKGLFANEFEKVKVLALWSFLSAGFHARTPIKTQADLKGMKFAVSGQMIGKIVAGLGGSPVSMWPTEIYQSASRGVIDGTVTSWTAVTVWKLHEVTKHHLKAPFPNIPAFLFMNKRSFNRLPDVAKKAIDRHSGEGFSRLMGKVVDDNDNRSEAAVKAKADQTIVTAELTEDWKKVIRGVTDGWVKTTPNGANILAAYRKEIANIRSK